MPPDDYSDGYFDCPNLLSTSSTRRASRKNYRFFISNGNHWGMYLTNIWGDYIIRNLRVIDQRTGRWRWFNRSNDLPDGLREELESVHSLDQSEVTLEKLIRSQADVTYCTDVQKRIEGEKTAFFLNNTGLLCRISHENQEQIVVPKDRRTNILYISHYSIFAGHTGGVRIYSTLRWSFYCPAMSIDVYIIVRNCVRCAKERLRHKRAVRFMKFF